MSKIDTIEALEALFDDPSPRSLTKVARHVTPLYRQWIEASKFCILSTVGPEGTDASPRGDAGPVVKIADERTIWMPDWRGNNRLDSLRNIVRDPRVSLMFLVPGTTNVVRVNGTAHLTTAPEVTDTFEQGGKHPKLVIVTEVEELYFQCAKAIMRSGLWDGAGPSVPTAGQFLKEMEASFNAKEYDETYPDYAKPLLW